MLRTRNPSKFVFGIITILFILNACASPLGNPLRGGEVRDNQQEMPAASDGRTATTGETGEHRVASTIQVEYKLDPRLTKGIFMGERWVSPRRYEIVALDLPYTVEARALIASGSSGAQKEQAVIEWTSQNIDVATVSPNQGEQVAITIHSPGETSLKITFQDTNTILNIKAANQEDAIKVQISQSNQDREG